MLKDDNGVTLSKVLMTCREVTVPYRQADKLVIELEEAVGGFPAQAVADTSRTTQALRGRFAYRQVPLAESGKSRNHLLQPGWGVHQRQKLSLPSLCATIAFLPAEELACLKTAFRRGLNFQTVKAATQ